ETDKARTAYAADSDGFLAIVAREGETLPVGDNRPASPQVWRGERRHADTRLHRRSLLIGASGPGAERSAAVGCGVGVGSPTPCECVTARAAARARAWDRHRH